MLNGLEADSVCKVSSLKNPWKASKGTAKIGTTRVSCPLVTLFNRNSQAYATLTAQFSASQVPNEIRVTFLLSLSMKRATFICEICRLDMLER